MTNAVQGCRNKGCTIQWTNALVTLWGEVKHQFTKIDCKTSTELETLTDKACVGTAGVHNLPGVTTCRVLSS